VSARGDGERYLGQMVRNSFGITERQHQHRALVVLEPDCAEDIVRFSTLVFRCRGPRPASGRAPCVLVLLADQHFLLEPNLYPLALRESCSDLRQLGGKAPFLSPPEQVRSGRSGEPCRQLYLAQSLKVLPHGRYIKRHNKFVMKPLDQVDQPPANNAMDRRDRNALDHFDKRSALRIIEQRLSSRRLAIEQTTGTSGAEPHRLVTHDL
jgi:hypothetical protein